jgi:CheY-like chemotaxis protein
MASGARRRVAKVEGDTIECGPLILVVDDDEEVREALAGLLAIEGYEVHTVPSANAAWAELAHGANPAAIVSDLWMPGMSGGEFVRALRASKYASIPVLILSGSHSNNEIEYDADAFETKPVEATTLVRAVDRLVRFGRRRGPVPAVGTLPRLAVRGSSSEESSCTAVAGRRTA